MIDLNQKLLNQKKSLCLFDLDNTVIDSTHRTPTLDCGGIDLESYQNMQTKEFIDKDSLLPLYDVMRQYINMGMDVGIVMARRLTKHDYSFLKSNKIKTDLICSRDKVHRISDDVKDHYFKGDSEYKRIWFHFLKEIYPLSEYDIFMFDDRKDILKVAEEEGLIPMCAITLNKQLSG